MKGVDAASGAAGLPEAMREYAQQKGCVVIATGETDYVTDDSGFGRFGMDIRC
ncbi:hydroxyethylthiazole kinase [Effusibacillus pohliae]|uniref:hydroxyethylthiazole kinase n=1 Tax=Effusibacillus pohliae TaxID=232270 RepID=UPI00036DC10A|nr:hydroxyethylthiazole kinase [Effusibacillus pohliae]